MADAMRAMLDGLMGSDRDMTCDEKVKNRRSLDSRDVDTSYLCGCSPYHLLSETKTETMLPREGWDKVRDEFLRREWEALPQEEKDKYGFEYDTMKLLEGLIDKIDSRIKGNLKKLAEEEALPPEFAKQVEDIDRAVKELQRKAEELGEQGDVDSSMSCINEAEKLKEQRNEIAEEHRPYKPCTACGINIPEGHRPCAMISEGDRHRLEDGRMYSGWLAMRKALKAYQEREGGPPQPKPRPSYNRDIERDRDKDKDKDRRKDRSRSRERRSRSRDRRRSRSRSRNRRRDDRYSRRDDRPRDRYR